jgi:hypothetical protein
MLLAELEVWHSRPVTPTRRVALGHLVLPVDPPPGFGGLLLGAVVAAHVRTIDEELVPDLYRLVNEIEHGQRIVQPRLRHRYQVDRHGLARSTHRLSGQGEEISFQFEHNGSSLQQVLGAIYSVERLAPSVHHEIAGVLHRALRWSGPVGPELIAHLAGGTGMRAGSLASLVDPVAWALDRLGFPPGTVTPAKRDVVSRYRARLMEIHPDHGGDEVIASKAIVDLGEARRILLGAL